MARVKSKASIKHKKIKKLTKGYKQARRRRVKAGKEAILHAGEYAYRGRKLKKRNFRKLWILRINAAVKELGLNYKKFIHLLKKAKIEINRKVLAEMAVKDKQAFQKIVKEITQE